MELEDLELKFKDKFKRFGGSHIPDIIEYLKEQYEKGNFIASGRKVPRIGGVILSKLTSKKELEKVLVQDPFHKANIATYEIIEFISSMTAKEFDNLKGGQ